MTPHIRPATLADIPALREMLVATWHATYDATLGVEMVNTIATTWHSLEKLSAECRVAEADPAGNALLVATHAGRIVGTASAHCMPGAPLELARLYIAADCQRGGIGKALLEACIARFPGTRSARLEVEPRNAGAIAFYARYGFASVASGSACGGDTKAGIEHLIMEAALPLLALRPARDDDAQDLFGLLTLCFAEYPGCYTDPHDDLRDLLRAGQWAARQLVLPDGAAHPLGGEFLVLEDVRGRICACVALDFPPSTDAHIKTAEIHRLYVRPDCRKRGIAEKLVARMENLARAAGAGRMILWSDTRFLSAHRLYERLGYARGPSRHYGDISNSVEHFFEKALG